MQGRNFIIFYYSYLFLKIIFLNYLNCIKQSTSKFDNHLLLEFCFYYYILAFIKYVDFQLNEFSITHSIRMFP